MAQPVWISPPGDLGTVAEGLFFSTPVVAVDPDGGIVKYKLIAGSLPEGIQVKTNGTVEGVPQAFAKVQGVPIEVSENVTSRFAVRAYVEVPGGIIRLSDRTFSITVSGQDLPRFVTPAGGIGLFYDGTTVNYQIEFTDQDPGDRITLTLEDGELPPGLVIDNSGLISGYITPVAPLPDTAIAGYDRAGTSYDQFPWDFSSRSISKNYEFTLQISDGKDRTQRTYEMYVVSKDSMTADTTDFLVDFAVQIDHYVPPVYEYITADVLPQRTPFITNYPTDGNIGTYRHSNFFAYQFQAIDLDGDALEYEIALGDSSDLPPGLSLDQTTGWLYGYLPNQGATETAFNFSIYVYKRDNPSLISPPYPYSITTIGDVETAVTWLTPSDLGVIENGAISLLQIQAVNASGRQLFYQFKQGGYEGYPTFEEGLGVYNKLPQGLQLLPSGNIAGRVSFNTFALDGGTTTFDKEQITRLITKETTFDSTFTFTVNAYSQDGLVSVFKTFSIRVKRVYNEPYESLYIQAMPGEADRQLLDSLLQNQDIIQPSFLYRSDDPYFALPTRIIYQHAFGLTSSTLEDYVLALELNHFRKQLVLGEFKVAQARQENIGGVVYEVVYSEVQDSGVNSAGESPPQTVPTAFPIPNPDGPGTIDKVYPNSLVEMRDQVIDTVGQYSQILPLWMTSRQANGRVLGFTKACVIAYCQPGKGEQLAYNIRTQWGERLNLIDFMADRYILDRQYSINWDPVTKSWDPSPAQATTFDRVSRPSNLVYQGEVDYATQLAYVDINNQTLQRIAALGGIDGANGQQLNGRTLIFQKQEDFPDGMSDSEAFSDYPATYDQQPFDEAEFDEAPTVLPTIDRLARYQINVIGGNYVSLELLDTYTTYDYLLVTRGDLFAGTELYLPAAPTTGLSRITWSLIPEIATQETIFDGGSTVFIVPEDNYGLTDVYNKYLVYPKYNILGGAPQ
jgi:hypothetical protein